MPIPHDEKAYNFVQRVWIATGIVSFSVVMLLLLKTIFSVLLLVLAGALIAIFFRALAGLIQQKFGWPTTPSLLLSTIGTFLLIAAIVWLIGSKVAAQTTELSETIPAAVEKTKNQLQTSPLGQKIVQKLSSPETIKKARGIVSSLFRTTFGVLGDVYVVILLGLFFTISPKPYTGGFLQLIPGNGRRKGRKVVNTIGDSLKKWLKGKLFAMLVVFILTAIGLSIVGVPLWLTLALIAGLLNFIPNFGPLIAMIPAVLIGFSQSMNTAIIIAGLYILIQMVESNIITPSVQNKLIKIPPALIIIGQLVMGILTGGWGLILATPLIAILMAVVQETYLKRKTKEA
ncbi:MAG: AI-2E family transporter [Flavisolibacter sp.]